MWQTTYKMRVLNSFNLTKHRGLYESWPRASELIDGGNATGKTVPGYVLEAQFSNDENYLFVTSWDRLFEESLEVVLLDLQLNLVARKTLGAMYSSFSFESAEVISSNQILVCATDFPDEMKFRISIDEDLQVELYSERQGTYIPYPLIKNPGIEPKVKSWWKQFL